MSLPNIAPRGQGVRRFDFLRSRLAGPGVTRAVDRRAWARVFLTIALTVFLLPGCSAIKGGREKRRLAAQKKVPRPPKAPQLVGTIVLVSLEGNFVLIDNESRPSPTMGTVLRTGTEKTATPEAVGADPGTPVATPETVELRVTEVRKRPFVTADDLVFE